MDYLGNGIAHTRWATHGDSELNAHPHQSGNKLAVVHNGIIENHDRLRQELKAAGYHFETETDTEVAAHLIHFYMQQGNNLLEATIPRLEGSYAIVAMTADEPEHLIAVHVVIPSSWA